MISGLARIPVAHKATPRQDFIHKSLSSLMSRFSTAIALFLILAWFTSCSKEATKSSTQIIGPAELLLNRPHPPVLGWIPSIDLTDVTGEPFSSESLMGKPWIVNFAKHPNIGIAEEIADNVWTVFTGSAAQIQSIKDAGKVTSNDRIVLVDGYHRVRGNYEFAGAQTSAQLATDLAALEAEIVNVPDDLVDPQWMKEKAEQQLASADSINAFHDFSFSDQRQASGIRFMHKIVDDSGKQFKGVHYDHGSGLSVADIDGDDLLDLYFVNQVGGNELWRNLGDGKFENITERAGVFVSDRIGVSASFADIDNDGDPDLYVTALRKGNVLFENLGGGRFRNITAISGLGYKGHSSGAVFFDYDRDGLVDVLVTNVGQYTTEAMSKVSMESIRGEAETGDTYNVGFNDAFAGHLKPERNERSRLYRNMGGNKFLDVSDATGMDDEGWTGDATPVDLNTDGWPDLYMLNMQGDDEVYLNQAGKSFRRAGRELFPKTPWGSMGIKAFDFENDGDLDLYLTDMHSDMSEHISPEQEKDKAAMKWAQSFLQTEGSSIFGNAFYRKTEAGNYEEQSDDLGAENYWPWGLSADDINADGFDDAFITSSMNFPLRYGVNSLLLNESGKRWRDAEFILGVEPRAGGLAMPWFELDLVGADKNAPVLETLNKDPKQLRALPDRVVVWGAMGSRSSVLLDLDDDGDLDIVTNELNHHPMVLVSDLSERKADLKYLKIDLEGTQSNRSALGAVVRIEAGDLKLMKVKDGQTGYLSHSDMPLYFGLGNAIQVDRVEVSWPSGIIQVLNGPIDKNQTLTVKEHGGQANNAVAPPSQQTEQTSEDGPFYVEPGQDIQTFLEYAAEDPQRKEVVVKAGTYRPKQRGQAMIWFNKRHDGITLKAEGKVILTAANANLADKSAASFPAIVNHVVYFGDGVSRKTKLDGFTITGANGFVTDKERPICIQPDIQADNLKKAKFFYTDGGGIKIFGRSYPTIENVIVTDNYTSPCGAGVSVEHRSHTDGSTLQSVLLRNCIFSNNRCPVSGAAVDLLHGSSAEITNCLFVDNLSNEPMDERAKTPGQWKPQHGSGALTLFPGSHVVVRRCTFTGNRNAVDDVNTGNIYEDSIFWKNDAARGWPSGCRYELDLASGVGVRGCFLGGGTVVDLNNVIDNTKNVLNCPNPNLDVNNSPQNSDFSKVGYRRKG